jgi:transcriptional regulator with XRE-family HTH domain
MSDELQKKIFSENLKRLMEEQNLTQADVAKSIGVSPQTFNTWVRGIALPRMGKIQRLADYFRVDKSDLLEDTINNKKTYYSDPEVGKIVNELKDRPDLRVLLDASRDLDESDMFELIDIINKIKGGRWKE